MVFRSPVCDIQTCAVSDLVIGLVERVIDSRHI